MAKVRKIRSSEVDFGVNSLPKNRTMLFFSLIKRRLLLLFELSLISIVFMAPTIVFETISRTSIFSNIGVESIDMVQLTSYLLFSSLISLVLNFVFCLGISGLVYILQKLIFEKIVFFSDYFKGMKENLSLSIVFSLFFTIAYLIFKFSFVFSINNADFDITKSIGFGFSILLLFTVIIIGIISFTQNCTYKLNFGSLIFNSFKFYLNGLLIYLLIVTVSFFYMFTILFGSFVIDVVFGILLIFLSPISVMIFVLYSNSKFDKFINKDNYPELVDIGINRINPRK